MSRELSGASVYVSLQSLQAEQLARVLRAHAVATGAVGARQEVKQVCENSTYRIYHLRVRVVTP